MSQLNLLVEIGTEEIPAGYLPPALKALEQGLARFLIGAPEDHKIKAWGTPNRLAVGAWGLIDKESDVEKEVTGPPVKAAYDADGKLTKAAQGFARGQGVDVSDLITVETKKGKYVAVRKTVKGRMAEEILIQVLPDLILGLPFPKSMRWGRGEVTFVRPIHWVLAVLDGKILDFSLGAVKASKFSYGHRFLHHEPIEINSPDEYEEKLAAADVIVSPGQRQKKVRQEINRAVAETGPELQVLSDEELVLEVTNMVEQPIAICGQFESSFLDLPGEVLITAMREHQRYFAITDDQGALKPYFVAINNTRARDMDIVTRGHQRVLKARLDDARFYFTMDRKSTLESCQEELNKVVFHSFLGTSWEKVMRMTRLAAYLADQLDPDIKEHLIRAAELCKCDLVTGLVTEFPSLQGTMGQIYAELDGEPPEVARAIYEHYLPIRAGGDLPQSSVGALLSLADKIETIIGYFSVGLIPTGEADPYALRRLALGVINIVLNRGYHISLDSLINYTMTGLTDWMKRPEAEIRVDVLEFFRLRLKNQLTSLGASTDGAEAVLSLHHDNIVTATARVWALEKVKSRPEFADLALAFKRVVNIIKKFGERRELDPNRFIQDEEKFLFTAYKEASTHAQDLVQAYDYTSLLNQIVALKPAVDSFFDEVLVDDPDQELKDNRLALLTEVSGLFAQVADFSKIST
ncbi:MAG: glycine--tRNA ligase subunit beta [Deltaproteobacteria bacterium]|nr:glycine--tRNA ligase subunit beta [Deltaproteobacteria bacterium]MBW2086087.1 glycine--tRNA ligase subunit beta [Deltaproteobacteria bacterium]